MEEQNKKIKILVVDDNTDFRSTLVEYFKGKGYLAKGAANGQKALRLLGDSFYDVVLLDLNMPIMNGMETMERIHAISENIQIIIITGQADVEKYYYYKDGCICFEEKPIDVIEIEMKVNNLLRAINKRVIKNKNRLESNSFINKDIIEIQEYILDNIRNYNLNADVVSEHFGISKKKLYQVVGNALTISVHDMIKYMRILKAHEYINMGAKYTIKDLSLSVGYRDPGYFSKIYEEAMDKKLKKEISNKRKRMIKK